MIAKKNPKFNLEKNRMAYLQLGLFIGASMILTAFTWKTPTSNAEKQRAMQLADIPVEVIPKMEKMEEQPEEEVFQPQEDPTPPQDNQAQQNALDLNQDLQTQQNKDKDVDPSINPDIVDHIKIGDSDLPELGEPPVLDAPVEYPDEDAIFPGGPHEMKKFILNQAEYPAYDLQMGNKGKIYVLFIIEKDGSVSNVKTLNSISKGLDREAIRIVKSMPKWTPAVKDGEKVRTFVRIPINFETF
ncbi:protein TonB [Lishizhenia tianjinensis]|uniref:Protein TonB n=1 Tax=Lishizhenia tianjinensis TaxID=477690 RepID=A0A1I6ZXF9_9FLAO|nr:energy transducer TonB [Lishizhenia tianjinensis]SFT67341.1 protein TonB [Lishizhenia tianjinensis]